MRPPCGGPASRRWPARPGPTRPAPPLLMAKAGGKPAGRGISISPLPAPHPLKRPIRGELRLPPIGCTPRSCSTGSLPAAKAYFVTPPPLGCRRDRPGISEAWHRRRPGGPSWYSATTFRACRVTPMRAAQGAAAPVTKLPGKLAAMPARSLPCPYSPPPPWAPVLGGAGGENIPPAPSFSPFLREEMGGARRVGASPGGSPR